jgi:hypothetical protein
MFAGKYLKPPALIPKNQERARHWYEYTREGSNCANQGNYLC